MMKNTSDTEAKDETKRKGQIARSVKTKSAHFCGQGADSQPEVKAKEDKWLESKRIQKEQKRL